MKNKILIGVGVFLLLMSALNVEAGCKKFQSSSDIEDYTTETWFRECDECIYVCPSVKGCPKNEHKVRRLYDCETYCDFCQDWDYSCTMPTRGFATCCDPAWCCSWATDGCTGEPTKQVVCGIGDDKWRTIDASGWMCPTCADLALWHGGSPPILDLNSFDSLSIRDENNFLRSEEVTDFTFEVYIEACLNRIPMMNLKVELVDALTSAVRSYEYGIYSKHRTMDYTTEVGLLEGFILPNQTEFAKNHEVRGILKGYRPWAWRQRLTGAMEAIVVARGLSIPGFPTTPTPQRIGDLYFSKDFLAGLDLPGGGITCEELITHHQTFTLDVLHKLPKLASTEMCSADDLINYYSSNGVTPQLEAALRAMFPIGAGNMTAIDVKETNRRLRLDQEERKNVDVTSLGYTNSSDFIANASNPSNYDDIFSELRAAGIITDAELKNNSEGELSDFLDMPPQGCGNYSPSFGDYTLLGISTKQKGPNKVDMDLDIDCRWGNTVFVELDISLQSSYNCSESWSWGSLADLNTEILAKCLYNWDECFFNPHTIPGYGGTYQEAVDCGMGPPPDLLDTTLKDAARGDKTISFNTVVYRWCGENERWMSPSAIWACSGDRAWGYPPDSNEGNASWVWKCGYEPSLDLTSFVMKKNISTPFDLDTVVPAEEYVCSYVAPHGVGPDKNNYKWVIDNPPNITIFRPRLLEYGGMNDDVNNTVSFSITDEVDINESSVYVRINGTTWDGYYDIISSTFDGALHCTNWGLDSTTDEDAARFMQCSYNESLIKPGILTVTVCARDYPRDKETCASRTFKYIVLREIKGMCYRWNAISLPLLPLDSSGNPDVNVATTPILQGLPYDRLSRHRLADIFDSFAPEIPEVISQSLKELAVGKGYFIFINDTTRTPGGPMGCINKSYYGIPDPSGPKLVMNSSGWYFFGVQSNSPLLNGTINDTLSDRGITSNKYTIIYYYDKGLAQPYGDFVHYCPGDNRSAFDNFTLGRGYWINYTGSGDTLLLY